MDHCDECGSLDRTVQERQDPWAQPGDAWTRWLCDTCTGGN